MFHNLSMALVIYDLFLRNYYDQHSSVHLDYVNELREIIKKLSSEFPCYDGYQFCSRLLIDNLFLSKGRYKFLQEYVKFFKCFCL